MYVAIPIVYKSIMPAFHMKIVGNEEVFFFTLKTILRYITTLLQFRNLYMSLCSRLLVDSIAVRLRKNSHTTHPPNKTKNRKKTY